MSRSFNGSSDTINCGTNTALIPASLSVFGWINLSSLSNSYTGVFNRFASESFNTNGDCAYFVKSNGKTALYLADNFATGGTENYDGTGAGTISTNTWTHVGFVFPSSGNAHSYINGVLDGSVGAGNTTHATTSVQSFVIGSDPHLGGRFLSGRVADVGVWSAALTVGEIAGLAGGRRPSEVRQGALVGWWPLDGLASPEPDLSGNAFNGTLTGTSAAAGPPVSMFTPRWPLNSPPATAGSAFSARYYYDLGTRVSCV